MLQRLLHQQIRLRVRLGYDWATLYECVFALMETLAGVVKSGTVTVEDPVWTAVDRVREPRTPALRGRGESDLETDPCHFRSTHTN